MKTLEGLEEKHQEAMRHIRKELENEVPHYPEYTRLVRAIIEFEGNPYSFLPSGWKDIYWSSVNIDAFIQTIKHAIIDDGEISFLEDSKGRGHLVFAHEHDFDDEESVETFVRTYSSVWKHCKYVWHTDVDRFIESLKKHH